MDIFGEEGQPDLFALLRIIRRMNLKLPPCRRERDTVHTFLDIFRLKVIIHIDIHTLVFIA